MHYNGGSVDTAKMPEGTEICAMHNSGKLKGKAAIWTWKDNDTTGRVLGITGHPEGKSADDQKRYMGACMLLLTDGHGRPDIKHQLENGADETVMDKETGDNEPLNTKIGDKQYHHFIIILESPAKDITITLEGEEGYDFHLFAAQDRFAFNDTADYLDTTSGPDKELIIEELVPACTLYVGVKLATTVISNQDEIKFDRDDIFIEYSGQTEVLDGIAYSVKAAWDDVTDIHAMNNHPGIRDQIAVNLNGKNVYINVGKTSPQSLKIYDVQGRLCWEPTMFKTIERYTWQPQSAGMYIVRIESGNEILTKPVTIVK